MSSATRQAILDAQADVLAELDDLSESTAATNAALVGRIDALIVARLADFAEWMNERLALGCRADGELARLYLNRERRVAEGEDGG